MSARPSLRSCAAGGLAGALAALGGRLLPGFELVADEVDLYDHLERADLVITGEGHLDAQSFEGKVVGGVVDLAAEYDVPVAAVVGVVDDELRDRIPVYALVDRFGEERSLREPVRCIELVTQQLLSDFSG